MFSTSSEAPCLVICQAPETPSFTAEPNAFVLSHALEAPDLMRSQPPENRFFRVFRSFLACMGPAAAETAAADRPGPAATLCPAAAMAPSRSARASMAGLSRKPEPDTCPLAWLTTWDSSWPSRA